MMKSGKFINDLIRYLKCLKERDSQGLDDLRRLTSREEKHFTYESLVAATENFSLNNKLGEGGFGPVYKGKLMDGREIAVKKLSHASNQGKKQFMNEAKFLATVQHRNVVQLYGYCVHDQEKLLVYEYLINKSLDRVLFDSFAREQLDWSKRYEIMLGVARGLQYLHEDAPACLIHRDIKPGNILLDEKWEPKVADFGMARLFPEGQTHLSTRVAGTRGYMAPEYVTSGQLSVMVDVFSFGVLILELITARKCSSFTFDSDADSLLEWVWASYMKGQSLDVMDPTLARSADKAKVETCIKIGLLCTQQSPKQRPSMQRVLVLLSKKHGKLVEPIQPTYLGMHSRHRCNDLSTPWNSSHGDCSSSSIFSNSKAMSIP